MVGVAPLPLVERLSGYPEPTADGYALTRVPVSPLMRLLNSGGCRKAKGRLAAFLFGGGDLTGDDESETGVSDGDGRAAHSRPIQSCRTYAAVSLSVRVIATHRVVGQSRGAV